MSPKTAALVVGLAIALCATASAADPIAAPVVPTKIRVPEGYKPFLAGHAIGTQNWMCVAALTPTGGDWVFIGPQATIYDGDRLQILTHYQSKNPDQGDAIQAEWQSSRDTSGVWATRVDGSLDPDYVAPGAIEWLLLRVTGFQFGPTGGDRLTSARYIQRVNTVGGAKPAAADCYSGTLNTRQLVYYEADYFFYR
jgi:hypothetical protein